MKKGFVKEYDSSTGFGFITGENNEDYFVRVSGLKQNLKKKGLFSYLLTGQVCLYFHKDLKHQ